MASNSGVSEASGRKSTRRGPSPSAMAESEGRDGEGPRCVDFLPDATLTPLFEATVQALDEAVIDALVANQAMTGRDGFTVPALPHDAVRALLREHKRLAE